MNSKEEKLDLSNNDINLLKKELYKINLILLFIASFYIILILILIFIGLNSITAFISALCLINLFVITSLIKKRKLIFKDLEINIKKRIIGKIEKKYEIKHNKGINKFIEVNSIKYDIQQKYKDFHENDLIYIDFALNSKIMLSIGLN